MNFETLRRIGELEHKVGELTKKLEALQASVSKIEKQQERRTITLPKKNA